MLFSGGVSGDVYLFKESNQVLLYAGKGRRDPLAFRVKSSGSTIPFKRFSVDFPLFPLPHWCFLSVLLQPLCKISGP